MLLTIFISILSTVHCVLEVLLEVVSVGRGPDSNDCISRPRSACGVPAAARAGVARCLSTCAAKSSHPLHSRPRIHRRPLTHWHTEKYHTDYQNHKPVYFSVLLIVKNLPCFDKIAPNFPYDNSMVQKLFSKST